VEATGAAVTAAILKGANMVRVHDVKAMARVVKIADAIRYDRGLTAP
jgi:dihydropteroate synthase